MEAYGILEDAFPRIEGLIRRQGQPHHGSDGADTFQWSVSGDTLTITYLSDTMPSDIPRGEEIYQRVLYMSSPWTRGNS